MKMKKITVIRNKEIHTRYNELVNSGVEYKDAIVTLSKDNDIGESYVKNILKVHGVKETSKNKETKAKRDGRIVEMYMNGKDHSEIAEEFSLTTTRVGQILRSHLGKHAKSGILEKSLEELKVDINSGMDHKAVQDKYGASLLRKIKANLGYNAFNAWMEKRNKNILALYNNKKSPMSAAEIAEEYELTRDHVYGILHEFGVRSKPTRAEYRVRNEKIVKAFKVHNKSSQEIAEEHDMTVTNVNIILKKHGARE